MFFSDVLDIHDSCCPKGSHADVLGDGFLMHSNPIYRNVKAFSVKIGCQYIEAYQEYLLLPFHELPKLVARKEIPFVPAARLMKNVELATPSVFTTDDVPMPPSYHLHESAHMIAEHFLTKMNPQNQQEEILKILLAESFANTVDALASIYADNEMHRFFIKQNSYMNMQGKVLRAMNELNQSMGFNFTFMLTFFTYVQANFLLRRLSQKSVLELAKRYGLVSKISSKTQKSIQIVCAIGEELDPVFRYLTTANYFKQQGYQGEIQDLLDFPFMKVFEGNPGWRKSIESMSNAIAPDPAN